LETRFLGSLEVSVVGLGTNNFGTDFFGQQCDVNDAVRIIFAAVDAGVTLLDTAEEYSVRGENGSGQSEQFIGEALKRLGSRRHDLVIATKFLNVDLLAPDERGPKRIVRAVEGSLKRLGVDHVDLYQQHRPDPDTPIEDTLAALDRLVRDGKVREIGCSRFSGRQIDEAQAASVQGGLARFVSSQSQYSVLESPPEAGVLEACARNSMVLLPYYPLASGLLTGKYSSASVGLGGSRLSVDTAISNRLKRSLLTQDRLDTVARLKLFAEQRGHSLLELAISWLTSQSLVASVIAGATRPEQVVSNAASASWELSPDEVKSVEAIVGSAAEQPVE
jgi:aryl-alcohol dehydrogenase-like predicted oxidoreductase